MKENETNNFVAPNPDKPEIPNYKHQITNLKQ